MKNKHYNIIYKHAQTTSLVIKVAKNDIWLGSWNCITRTNMHNQDMGDTVSVEWHKGLWGGTCGRSLWSATTAVQEILWDLTGTWENLRKFTLNMSHVKSFCNSNVVLLHKSCHNVKKSFVSLKLLQRNLLPLSNNKLFFWLISWPNKWIK